jgi:hypothetical protein
MSSISLDQAFINSGTRDFRMLKTSLYSTNEMLMDSTTLRASHLTRGRHLRVPIAVTRYKLRQIVVTYGMLGSLS